MLSKQVGKGPVSFVLHQQCASSERRRHRSESRCLKHSGKVRSFRFKISTKRSLTPHCPSPPCPLSPPCVSLCGEAPVLCK
ncbi:hypothetical protein M3J09_013827 [Ascochyta lentis]